MPTQGQRGRVGERAGRGASLRQAEWSPGGQPMAPRDRFRGERGLAAATDPHDECVRGGGLRQAPGERGRRAIEPASSCMPTGKGRPGGDPPREMDESATARARNGREPAHVARCRQAKVGNAHRALYASCDGHAPARVYASPRPGSASAAPPRIGLDRIVPRARITKIAGRAQYRQSFPRPR
jgi:hypothetical protein